MSLNVLDVCFNQPGDPNFRFQLQLRGRDLAVRGVFVYGLAHEASEIPAFIWCEIAKYIQRSLAGVESAPATADGAIIRVHFSQFILKAAVAFHVLISSLVGGQFLAHIIILLFVDPGLSPAAYTPAAYYLTGSQFSA